MDLHIFDALTTLPEVHNNLRRLICIDCLPVFPVENQRSFRIFKANSRNYLSIDEQGLDDPLKIFDALEAKGKIRVGEYDTLKTIVKDADDRILSLIGAAEKRMRQIKDAFKNERRILIIGKTGVGKSETGNRLLGKREFETDTSDESVTACTALGLAERFGKRLLVVDTPGLFDTKRTNEETISEIMKCYAITTPGLHAILLVHDIGRMTDEQINTINIFQERFGKENLDRFLILVFTGKERLTNLGKTIDNYVNALKPESNLKKLLESIGNRYVALSLTGNQEDLKREMCDLMAMIERVFEVNNGQCYTNDMYRQAEKIIQDRLAEVKRRERERYEKEMHEAMEPMRAEHAQKERELQDQIQEKERELEKRKRDENIVDKAVAEWKRFEKRGYKIAW